MVEKLLHFWVLLRFWFKSYFVSGFTTLLVLYYVSGSNKYHLLFGAGVGKSKHSTYLHFQNVQTEPDKKARKGTWSELYENVNLMGIIFRWVLGWNGRYCVIIRPWVWLEDFHIYRAPDKVIKVRKMMFEYQFNRLYLYYFFTKSNFYHLLESSRWDDSIKWSNIWFDDEIGDIEIKTHCLSRALSNNTLR